MNSEMQISNKYIKDIPEIGKYNQSNNEVSLLRYYYNCLS